MKRFVFILSLAFAMFLSNATFAATTKNSLVTEKAEITLTETSGVADVSNALVKADPIIIIIDDGTVIIIV
ncbi:MAG: hypothetical protein ACK5H1_08970 [Tenacibaculum sp.]